MAKKKNRKKRKNEQRPDSQTAPSTLEAADQQADEDEDDGEEGAPAPWPEGSAAPQPAAASGTPPSQASEKPAEPSPSSPVAAPSQAAAPIGSPVLPASSEPAGPFSWPATLARFLEEQFQLTKAYACILVVAVVFACYANSLFVPFLFDDAPVITRNRNFWKPLSVESCVAIAKQHVSRALVNVTFFVNYKIAGTKPYQLQDGTYGSSFTYHIVNMALHMGNAVFLFLLVSTLLASSPAGVRGSAKRAVSGSGKGGGGPGEIEDRTVLASWIALGATLLWVVHPVQTMAVSYIAQRYTLVAAMAFLGCMLTYAKLRRRMEAGTAWDPEHLYGSLFLFFATPALFVACCLSKENAVTAPFVAIVMDLAFFQKPRREAGAILPTFVSRWLLAATLVFIFAAGVFVRWSMVGLSDLLPPSCPTFPDRMSYFRTQWVVIFKYLRLFAMPTDLAVEQNFPAVDWDKNPNAIIHSEVVPFTLALCLLGHVLVFGLGAYWWFTKRRFLAFCIAWYYLTLAVESSVIPILDPMVEHRLYLPSTMVAAGLAWFVGQAAASVYDFGPSWTRDLAARFFPGEPPPALAKEPGPGSTLETIRARVYESRHEISCYLLGAWLVLSIAFALGTHVRNRVWSSETGIWEDTIEKHPDCARAYSSLGMELLYKGHWVEAIQPIETALELGPFHVEGWNNLGKAYLEIGTKHPLNARTLDPCPYLVEAERALIRGIEVNKFAPSPSVPLCWNNLGLTYMQMAARARGPNAQAEMDKLYQEAAESLAAACELDPGYQTAWINLGKCFLKQAERAATPEARKKLAHQAARAIEKSGVTDPRHQLFASIVLDLAQAYRLMGRNAPAFLYYDLAAESFESERDILLPKVADTGMDTAWEQADLPGKVDDLEKALAAAQDPTKQKDLKDRIAVAKDELADIAAILDRLKTAVKKLEDVGAVRAAAKERGAGPLLRAAGWMAYFLLDDPARAVKDLDQATLATPNAPERSKIEHEKRCAERGDKISAWGAGSEGPSLPDARPGSGEQKVGPR